MADATLSVFADAERVVLGGYSRGPVTWTVDGRFWCGSRKGMAPAVLGLALRQMLLSTTSTERIEAEAPQPLFAAAGVRSYRQLRDRLAEVVVAQYGDELELYPTVVVKSGVTTVVEERRVVLGLLEVSDEELGRQVLELLVHGTESDADDVP